MEYTVHTEVSGIYFIDRSIEQYKIKIGAHASPGDACQPCFTLYVISTLSFLEALPWQVKSSGIAASDKVKLALDRVKYFDIYWQQV